MNYLIAAVAFIFALVSFIFMPWVTDSFHETIVESQTDTGNLTTAIGETSGDFVLTMPLYMERLGSVLELDSSLGTDSPSSAAYDEDTQALEVSGLTADGSRILTVEYEYDATTDFTNSRQVISSGPVIIMLALIVIIIGIPLGMGYMVYRRATGR